MSFAWEAQHGGAGRGWLSVTAARPGPDWARPGPRLGGCHRWTGPGYLAADALCSGSRFSRGRSMLSLWCNGTLNAMTWGIKGPPPSHQPPGLFSHHPRDSKHGQATLLPHLDWRPNESLLLCSAVLCWQSEWSFSLRTPMTWWRPMYKSLHKEALLSGLNTQQPCMGYAVWWMDGWIWCDEWIRGLSLYWAVNTHIFGVEGFKNILRRLKPNDPPVSMFLSYCFSSFPYACLSYSKAVIFSNIVSLYWNSNIWCYIIYNNAGCPRVENIWLTNSYIRMDCQKFFKLH